MNYTLRLYCKFFFLLLKKIPKIKPENIFKPLLYRNLNFYLV